MATERLSMRQTREILRQNCSLGRTHREVALSLVMVIVSLAVLVGLRERWWKTL